MHTDRGDYMTLEGFLKEALIKLSEEEARELMQTPVDDINFNAFMEDEIEEMIQEAEELLKCSALEINKLIDLNPDLHARLVRAFISNLDIKKYMEVTRDN